MGREKIERRTFEMKEDQTSTDAWRTYRSEMTAKADSVLDSILQFKNDFAKASD